MVRPCAPATSENRTQATKRITPPLIWRGGDRNASRIKAACTTPRTDVSAAKWFWTMTATHPGPRFPIPTNGIKEKQADTGRYVIKCDQRIASFYGVYRLAAQCYLPRLTP